MSGQHTTYAGIDYGMGRTTNVDLATGIRYGVIAQNSVGQAWDDSAEADYGEAHCPKCGNEVKASDDPTLFAEQLELGEAGELNGDGTPAWFDGQDYACLDCEECFQSDECFNDEPLGWSFEDTEYTLSDCLDSDIFILKSPYYTYAQFCSPCVPGACSLDNPLDAPFNACTCIKPHHDGNCQYAGVPRCYALGHEWFEGGKAPYRVFRVADDVELVSERVEVSCETCVGTGRRTAKRWMNLREDTGFKGDSGQALHVGDTFTCNLCSGTGKRTKQQIHAVEVSS